MRPDDPWCMIRLALLPFPLPRGADATSSIAADPAIVRWLWAGDVTRAVELARRRLAAAGIRPPIIATSMPGDLARHMAAALAFPISQTTARRLAERLDPASSKESLDAR